MIQMMQKDELNEVTSGMGELQMVHKPGEVGVVEC